MQVTLRARLGMIIKFNKESWRICYAVKSSLSCDIFFTLVTFMCDWG